MASAPTLQVVASQTGDDMVIQLKGEAGMESGGALLAALMGPAAHQPTLVTLDLSELRFISSLAMGLLVIYRRGVLRAGGKVRLADRLQPSVAEALARARLLDLFETTPSREAVPSREADASGVEAEPIATFSI
jgi:anti-anti-sigma factor